MSSLFFRRYTIVKYHTNNRKSKKMKYFISGIEGRHREGKIKLGLLDHKPNKRKLGFVYLLAFGAVFYANFH